MDSQIYQQFRYSPEVNIIAWILSLYWRHSLRYWAPILLQPKQSIVVSLDSESIEVNHDVFVCLRHCRFV